MKNPISGIVPTDPIQRVEIRFIAGDRARRKAIDDFEVENNVVLLHGIDGDCAVKQLHVVVLEDNILLRDGFDQRVSLPGTCLWRPFPCICLLASLLSCTRPPDSDSMLHAAIIMTPSMPDLTSPMPQNK